VKTKILIFIHAILLICFSTRIAAQNNSEEAKRYFDRGVAALEIATSPADWESAITEFKQAAVLAPDWPDILKRSQTLINTSGLLQMLKMLKL
jgi:hypothetical protein